MFTTSRRAVLLTLAFTASGASAVGPVAEELWRDVEVIRTEHGVPHIRATTLRAGGYGLAWAMSEDYGTRTVMNVLRASGNMARVFGRDSIESDFSAWRDRHVVAQNYHRLRQTTRDVYEGFAEGLNRYITLHPTEFPAAMVRFTGGAVRERELQASRLRREGRRCAGRHPIPAGGEVNGIVKATGSETGRG